MILAGVAVAHRRLGPSSSATTSTADRALPSSAVQHVLKVVAVADGGCRTGWWPRSPAWTIDSLTVRCGLRSPAQLLMARPGQDGYDLRHALLREVIDADLLPGERARLHAALAHNLVDLLGSGELDWSGAAAEVAVHRDRTHDRPKALEWSVRAAFASSASASRPPR
jgi:hypothetical protein